MDRAPFEIVVLTQEAGRPEEVRRAVAAAEVAGDLRPRVRGFQLRALKERPQEVAAAVAAADLLLVSHVLQDEPARQVVELVARRLPRGAQVLAMSSLRPVLELNRLGTLSWKGLRAMAARGELPPFVPRGLFEAEDLTETLKDLVTTAAALLPRIPPALGDLRAWVYAFVAWAEPTPAGLAGLVLMLADRYGRRKGDYAGLYGDPVVHPDVGLFHPRTGIVGSLDALPAAAQAAEAVGILLQRGAVLAGDTGAAAALIERLEARGLRPVPAFARSFDFREAVARYFDPAGVSAILNLSGFPLAGGHNRCEPEAAIACLAARDVLYLTPPSLMLQTVREWERSPLGLSPMETAMQVAIHELEGGIEPLVAQAVAEREGGKVLLEERAARLVARLERWLALRKKPNAEKRLVLTVFAFPPGKGSVGTAAYLDVFRSAWVLLGRLAAAGYAVEVPESPEALLARVVEGDPRAPIDAAGLAAGARLTVREYRRLAPESRRAERVFGRPPGALNTDGRDLLVPGVSLGNVFLGVQPSFGYEGDPMRLLFERGATPHHGFIAFYRWAEAVFGADAVVHLGTHGALEFMPGKQVGLSGACWPDLLLGTLPNVYLYAVNNPSEATIAKRRGYAVTVGHLTPPTERAGLYEGLAEAKALVAEYRESGDPARRRRTAEALSGLLEGLHLEGEVAPPSGEDPAAQDRFVGALYVALMEIEGRRIPVGLHALGREPTPAERLELLAAAAEHDRPDDGIPGLHALLEGRGAAGVDALFRGVRAGDPAAVEGLARGQDHARAVAKTLVEEGALAAGAVLAELAPGGDAEAAGRLVAFLEAMDKNLRRCDEVAPLLRALEGRWIPPGPGGDPVRAPDVLPTGRNVHALDPAAVPSSAALRAAEATVLLLLEERRAALGGWPRSIGLVLWGLDNIKTHGEAIAQAFCLLGVRPRRNSIGRVTELEVVPLEELGRPRIDVVLQCSGIFRDVFGLQMRLLDEAARLVAGLDEPEASNFVRARARELEDAGLDVVEARTRVFSNAPGSYGAHVDHMVGLSTWETREDIARVFLERKGFAYGTAGDGTEARHVLEHLAAGIDTTFQNQDSAEVSLTDVDHYFEYLGGLTALAESRSGRRPAALVADGTGARARIRSLADAVRLETRTRLLNPRWYEGMLRHGFEGAEEIRKRLDYTFGWSATCEAVDAWVYREVHRTYVEDVSVRDRMRAANAHAFEAMTTRLVEAGRRGFWAPTDEETAALHAAQEAAEDAIEGVR